MATNYPTSLDSFTNPTSSSTLNSPSHAAQHANANDAIEAIETKLGVGNHTIGTYQTYTPSFTGIAFSSYTARYARVNNLVHVWFSGLLSGAVTGTIEITTPTNSEAVTNDIIFPGNCTAFDVGSSVLYPGAVMMRNGASLQFRTAAYPMNLSWSNNLPFTWATGDLLSFDLVYEVA
jgi:hypothetical protein